MILEKHIYWYFDIYYSLPKLHNIVTVIIKILVLLHISLLGRWAP